MTLLNSDRLKKSATFAGILVSLTLIIVKFFAFIKTDSLAIFSSLVDSATDLFSSFISFVAVYFSTKPASYTHRYGYGKTESISALMQAVFVGASGCFVIFDGVNRLFNPIDVSNTEAGIFIMVFSIFATLLLVVFQLYVAKKTNSLAIKADTAHYLVDFLTNSAVIVSLVLTNVFNFIYFDIIAAIFISIYLLFNAYFLGKESLEQLTDKELSNEIRSNIKKVVLACENVMGIHDLRTRNVADVYYIEFHLELDGNKPLFLAHQTSEQVEKSILEQYPFSQILIHQDPYGIDENRLDNMIKETNK